ncbi:MBL fold metallo-hydrolase [Colwellia sp. 1_MG-2023]|uniref:MBL fold metallo-hydrolase n=1 Tax=Colwellia sp. 1_MG-2023 TaxID=3062649 RepID=UPI0026E21AE9|nr:MBL fold metallo-hydrolase [Colwellia sp. 1_MG-2023]MDO6447242.1 MBL fold metallo-hydrolase [Colwellia sp. 1_MG-2023]
MINQPSKFMRTKSAVLRAWQHVEISVSQLLFVLLILSWWIILPANNVYAHDFHSNKQTAINQVGSANHGESLSYHETRLTLDSEIENKHYVKYLGNEALFIHVANSKLLFDPFFHDNIQIYRLVPETIKTNIFNGKAPFNDIDLILISHAHRDHFAVDEVVNYLLRFEKTKLVAPQQAIDKINAHLNKLNKPFAQERLIPVKLNFGDQPWQLAIGNFIIDAVRIPHAGWPSRADVENMVFRVTLNHASTGSANTSATVMHMGDADPDDAHFLPYKRFWQQKKTDVNFPPYWFLFSAEGRDILDSIIGAKANIGVHVPMEVPKQLQKSGRDYFSTPGEIKSLK